MPGYQAGVPTGQAPEAIASGNIAQLASNESPFPPHPQVVEAIQATAAAMNRYPDPDATLLRRRLAERYETEPGRVAVGNGSCEILLAAAEALCEPGAEIVYAWPSFSMYPYLPALTGAREVRVPLAEGDVHDLDAMAAEVTAATQLLIVCNPNNPTATHVPAAEIAAFVEQIPTARHGDPRRGLRRVPDPRRSRRDARPARRLPEPGRPPHLQQVLRARRAAGRLRDRLAELPRRGRRRAPAVQRQRPRPGGRGGGDPAPGRRPAPGREHDRRPARRRGGPAGPRPRRPPTPTPTSPGSTSATPTKPRSSPASPSATSRSAPARPSAAPATSASATAPPRRTSASCVAYRKYLTKAVPVIQPLHREVGQGHIRDRHRCARRCRRARLPHLLAI